MKEFAELFTRLDETNKTNTKVNALVEYFRKANPEDAIWAIRFLTGRKPKRLVKTTKLREWAAEAAEIPDWLFEECYEIVGDLAETITLLLPRNIEGTEKSLNEWVQERLLPLRNKPEEEQKEIIVHAWNEMTTSQRFLWNKLITGGFRIGVSEKLVVRGLSIYSGVDEGVIAHRLMGNWEATPEYYNTIISKDTTDADISQPYPFYLAYPLENEPEDLGNMQDWQAEWKWDGIRAQIIKREDEVFIWSRGKELVTDTFPELKEMGSHLDNGTVIDGEIIPWKDDLPLDFSELQRRLGRKKVGKKLLSEVPVILLAYDILEYKGGDIRQKPLVDRREVLAEIIKEVNHTNLKLSETVEVNSWEKLRELRKSARDRHTEGLMLKHQNSTYKVGRKRGDWWKWKVDPLSVDAVMIYAQRGHGRRASLYTDYTFAVWNGNQLVPFAKAYSGLTDSELNKVDRFVKQNTIERFGPVRSVKPELVFEISFEGIRESKRHKSGVAVRFPRITRWRTDKKPEDADTIETIKALIPD